MTSPNSAWQIVVPVHKQIDNHTLSVFHIYSPLAMQPVTLVKLIGPMWAPDPREEIPLADQGPGKWPAPKAVWNRGSLCYAMMGEPIRMSLLGHLNMKHQSQLIAAGAGETCCPDNVMVKLLSRKPQKPIAEALPVSKSWFHFPEVWLWVEGPVFLSLHLPLQQTSLTYWILLLTMGPPDSIKWAVLRR